MTSLCLHFLRAKSVSITVLFQRTVGKTVLVCLFATLWTVAHQAPLSMGPSRQKYWSGWPFPTLGDLPNPGIEPTSIAPPALAGRFLNRTNRRRSQQRIWEVNIDTPVGVGCQRRCCAWAQPGSGFCSLLAYGCMLAPDAEWICW